MSSLMKWSPLFDNFDDFFKDVPTALSISNHGLIPPIDMYETKDAVVIETPLAGVNADKLDIEVKDSVLTIKGTTERKTEVDEKDYYRKEIRTGEIFRQINLPSQLKEEEASAEYKDGILRVKIPRIEDKGSKAIKIDVKKD